MGDGTDPVARDFLNYVPSARPGSLAPHAWLHDGSSLYDHFGEGFTLLATADAKYDEILSAQEAARAVGVPLRVIRPKELVIKDLYQARYALIRPDQYVAWRGNDWPDRPELLFGLIAGQHPNRLDPKLAVLADECRVRGSATTSA